MRRLPTRHLTALTAMLAVVAVGSARSAHAVRPVASAAQVRRMRAAIDRYRALTWTYERASRHGRTSTSYSYRRSTDAGYLQWTLSTWQRRAYAARGRALVALRSRLGLETPSAPGLHSSIPRRIAYARTLTTRLRSVYPGTPAAPSRSLASARAGRSELVLWQRRAASAALGVSRHATRLMVVAPPPLRRAFMCIHHYEGAWTANTGNGYYGGLQMDRSFMARYGEDYLRRWGTADRWPAWAQVEVSVRAYDAGRGFRPWPNSAALCGLF